MFRTGPLFLPLLLLAVACPNNSSRRVSGGVTARSADVALDGTGRAMILFASVNADQSSRDLWRIDYSPTVGFSAPQKYFDGAKSHEPRIALAPGGVHHSVWLVEGATFPELQVWGRGTSAVGTPLAAVELDPGPVTKGQLALAGDSSGNALAVWHNAGSIVASFGPAGSSFLPAVPIHVAIGDALAESPKVALNGAGDGAIVYEIDGGTSPDTLVAHRVSGGVIGPAEQLGAMSFSRLSRPAVAPDGTLLVAWYQDGASLNGDVVARRGSVASGWGAVESVAPLLLFTEVICVTLDGAANALVAWDESDVIHCCRAPFDGTFGPALATGLTILDDDELDCAAEPGGRVTIATVPGHFGHDDATATRFVDPRGAGPVRQLAAAPFLQDDPDRIRVVADASATAISVWVVEDAVHAYVWRDPMATFTWSPAAPTVGVPVAFDGGASRAGSTATALTRWEWHFDADGVVDAEGSATARVFPAPGIWPVKLVVRDEWDDAAEITLDVVVGSGGGGTH